MLYWIFSTDKEGERFNSWFNSLVAPFFGVIHDREPSMKMKKKKIILNRSHYSKCLNNLLSDINWPSIFFCLSSSFFSLCIKCRSPTVRVVLNMISETVTIISHFNHATVSFNGHISLSQNWRYRVHAKKESKRKKKWAYQRQPPQCE